MAEEYFLGLDEQIELDDEEQKETEGNTSDIRSIAVGFIRRLRDTGWLSEKDGEYEEESRLAINYKAVPIIKSFQEVINPSVITYKRIHMTLLLRGRWMGLLRSLLCRIETLLSQRVR